jgi:hypothetical protein
MRPQVSLSGLVCAAIVAACGSTEPSNTPPVAAFTSACEGTACVFHSTSTDADGTIASYGWSFGDGGTSSELSPAHTYAAPEGKFTVSLVVTDNDGAATSVSRSLTVGSGGVRGRPPAAAFSVSCSLLTCRFTDFSTVAAAGDSIVVHAWDFGDGTTSAESSPTHTYDAGAGTVHVVTLTVTDNHGASATVGQPVDANPDGPPPQGGQIAFSRDGKIFLANTDGTAEVQLSAGPADSEPAWSPDGSRVAFSRGGDAGGIYVMNADGSNPVRRASAGGSPTWSPDGQWVAFSCRVGPDGGICKVRADDDGTAPVPVFARAGVAAYPAWSPDGSRFAYSSDWNIFDFWLDLWMAPLDGSAPTMILGSTLTSGFDRVQPAWSPDGRRIALGSCPYGYTLCGYGAVAVMNADGSGFTQLALTTGMPHATWSPDGELIVFASAGSIEWVSVDGSQRGRVIANGSGPAWRPGH